MFCLICLVALSCTLVAQPADSKQSLVEIRNRIASTQGLERAELQLRILERNDAPIQERHSVATQLIEAFRGNMEPRILGLAYLAKGTTQGNQGDLVGGIDNLVEAESHAILCADKHPEILFKAKSNRAAFLVASGKGFEAAKLLQELIKFAKPHAVHAKGSIELVIQAIVIDEHQERVWGDVKPGQYVMFEVRDNGEGIAPEDLQRVCEPFFTTKKSKSGTGLGLSSVSGFVRQSMGELRLISELGHGTTVKFILPQCDAESTAQTTVDDGKDSTRRQKILVVEDQDSVRASTVFLLQMMGFEVCEADGAEKAIQLLEQSTPPEIVLSDIKMPGSMDGLGLRDWLNAKHPEIRVVLMSGFSELDNEFGRDFLQKPYSRDSLEKALRPPPVDA